MNNQNLNVINNPSIDRVLFSITFMRQQIRFKEDDGLIYNRNVIVIIGCNINAKRKHIYSVFEDDYSKTSDWYNLFLDFKSKGLIHAFFLISDISSISKAFKLAFSNSVSLYYLLNDIYKLSHYVSMSYSDNIIGKIRNICLSNDITEFNLKKDEFLSSYSDFSFVNDMLTALFDNCLPYFKYSPSIRKNLLPLYFLRNTQKRLNFIASSKDYFVSLNDYINLVFPANNSVETKMYCTKKEWNETIAFLYENDKNKELLLCEL